MESPATRLIVLIACIITMFAVSTVFMTQSIFLEISQSFSMDITRARFSFSIASLFYAGSFFFLGPAADKFDRPKMATTGLFSLSIFVLLASLSPHFNLFIIAMAFMGISAAFIPATMFPHLSLIAPSQKKGLYIGFLVAAGTLGVVFGRALMGLMTASYGWRFSFKLVALLIFILSIICFFTLVKNKIVKDKVVKAGIRRPRTTQQLSALYADSIRLIFSYRILSLLGAGFFLFFGFIGMITFLTYRLVAPPFNYSALEVGLISFAGITTLVAPFAGIISQKIGNFKIILPGIVICLGAVQLMGWFSSIILISLGVLLLFFGVYSCQPLLFLLIGQNIPQKSLGSASSLYILFCIGGGSISSIVLGPVWSSYGWTGITLLSSLSLLISFLIIAILATKK